MTIATFNQRYIRANCGHLLSAIKPLSSCASRRTASFFSPLSQECISLEKPYLCCHHKFLSLSVDWPALNRVQQHSLYTALWCSFPSIVIDIFGIDCMTNNSESCTRHFVHASWQSQTNIPDNNFNQAACSNILMAFTQSLVSIRNHKNWEPLYTFL